MHPNPSQQQAKRHPGVRRCGVQLRPVRLFKACIAAIALATFAAAAQAPLDVRVALVIGNADYAGAAALANPANDARAMASALKSLGFTVIELRNGSKAEMNKAVVAVRDALIGKQGVGLLYYAGHGLQLDWRNYMVPVDAKLVSATDVPVQAMDVNTVLDAFKRAGNRMNILVLDACRDNPFAASGSGKGLAQVDAPPGTFLAYATAPGNVAEDGDEKSGNGLYTQYLLEELKKPAAGIEDIFKRVRLNVRKQSQGRQIPWESTSLEDDFYFNAGLKVKTAGVEGWWRRTNFWLKSRNGTRSRTAPKSMIFTVFCKNTPAASSASRRSSGWHNCKRREPWPYPTRTASFHWRQKPGGSSLATKRCSTTPTC